MNWKYIFGEADIQGVDVKLEPLTFWEKKPGDTDGGLKLSESPIKYEVYIGAPIGRSVLDGRICFDSLKVGDEVVCPWLFGVVSATVTRLDGESGTAESKHQEHSLHYCKGRKCWATATSMAKRTVTSLPSNYVTDGTSPKQP